MISNRINSFFACCKSLPEWNNVISRLVVVTITLLINKKNFQYFVGISKNQQQIKLDKKENLIRSFVRSQSIKPGKKLDKKEMKQLVDELFACEKSSLSMDGKNTVVMLTMEGVKQLFK